MAHGPPSTDRRENSTQNGSGCEPRSDTRMPNAVAISPMRCPCSVGGVRSCSWSTSQSMQRTANGLARSLMSELSAPHLKHAP